MPISATGRISVDLEEAARQLEGAAHDAQVAYDSLSLGNLDWAHTSAIIARAEADAAENLLRVGSRVRVAASARLPAEVSTCSSGRP